MLHPFCQWDLFSQLRLWRDKVRRIQEVYPVFVWQLVNCSLTPCKSKTLKKVPSICYPAIMVAMIEVWRDELYWKLHGEKDWEVVPGHQKWNSRFLQPKPPKAPQQTSASRGNPDLRIHFLIIFHPISHWGAEHMQMWAGSRPLLILHP